MINLNTNEINIIFGGDAVCVDKSTVTFAQNDSGAYKNTFRVGAVIGKAIYAVCHFVEITAITTKDGVVNFTKGLYSAFHDTKKPLPVVDPEDQNL